MLNSATQQFDVVVIDDACRGIDIDGSMNATRRTFNKLGVSCVASDCIG